ncbi:MAG: PDZ domain-containing protein, partial [Planctomycetota bacterium]
VRVPVRYRFAGCEPDPGHPGGFLFLFDMNCDGKDLQKARWKGEEEKKPLAEGEAAGADVKSTAGQGVMVDVGGERMKVEQPPAKPAAATPNVKPVVAPAVPDPDQVLPTADEAPALFESSGSDNEFAATEEGARYLEKNYQEILKDAQVVEYRNRKTGEVSGLFVRSIRRGSAANAFGIREDDVILSINNQPVSSQTNAVNIVKAELNRKKTIIEVRILRDGQEILRRYDTRDPATRKAAKDLSRNR